VTDDLEAWGAATPPAQEPAQEAPPPAGLPAVEPAEASVPEVAAPSVEEAERQRAEAEQRYCKQQLRRVLERAKSDLSLKPHAYPMMDASAIWSRTIGGCRGDLPDGRFCEIDRDEVRFGNIKFAGSRRTPLT